MHEQYSSNEISQNSHIGQYCCYCCCYCCCRRIDHDKRGSFDDSNSKTHLEVSPEEEYRASSLPRGTKITITGITPEELEDKGTVLQIFDVNDTDALVL